MFIYIIALAKLNMNDLGICIRNTIEFFILSWLDQEIIYLLIKIYL